MKTIGQNYDLEKSVEQGVLENSSGGKKAAVFFAFDASKCLKDKQSLEKNDHGQKELIF